MTPVTTLPITPAMEADVLDKPNRCPAYFGERSTKLTQNPLCDSEDPLIATVTHNRANGVLDTHSNRKKNKDGMRNARA